MRLQTGGSPDCTGIDDATTAAPCGGEDGNRWGVEKPMYSRIMAARVGDTGPAALSISRRSSSSIPPPRIMMHFSWGRLTLPCDPSTSMILLGSRSSLDLLGDTRAGSNTIRTRQSMKLTILAITIWAARQVQNLLCPPPAALS
jgi:hypothetical protein